MNNWDSIANNGKVWLYLSKRPFSPTELQTIESRLDAFCANWAAHGDKLYSGYKIFFNQIIAIAVDNEKVQASGCSIDTSVEIMKQFDKEFDLDLFNRFRTFLKVGDAIETIEQVDFEAQFEKGLLSSGSDVFNSTALSKEVLDENLFVKLEKTWLKRYLKSAV